MNSVDQEARLLAAVEDLGERANERQAVHIHLSRLREHNRRSHHMRIAEMTFSSFVQRFEGQIFTLANADLVFLCKSGHRDEIDEVVDKLRYLFSEDPLTRADTAEDVGGFCDWYDLAKDVDAFQGAAQKLMGAAESARESDTDAPAAEALKPLEPKLLDLVEKALSHADISTLLRRQPVCVVVDGKAAREPVFTELYVSIADLQEMIAPGIDLLANRWLFQYLTQVLDKRVLAYLKRARRDVLKERISININMATLLSPEFVAFDSELGAEECGTIAIELQSFDIIADMSSFQFICDFLRDRGYRLCFDGLTHLTLQYIDRQRLGIDLLKVYWSADMADYLSGGRLKEMRQFVTRAGEGRIILCRCDTEQAIEIGQSLGISLFQGRYVDAMLSGRAAAQKAMAS
jgi:EAL domain-containing protein (putative c-di-GMP-specific phosphodiesterase class I)